MTAPTPVISAESSAAKCAAPGFAAHASKNPHHKELLWFLQGLPGGVAQFIETLLDASADALATGAMREIGKTGQPYSADERAIVIESFPRAYSYQSIYSPDSIHNNPAADAILDRFDFEMRDGCGFDFQPRRDFDHAKVNKRNHAYFAGVCREYARVALHSVLGRFCADPACASIPDVWFFHDLPGALIKAMDDHARRAALSVVQTAVTQQTFDALDFAWTEVAMVEIIGDSRFGKTESVKAWCAMYPGRARLVKTPFDNSIRSLIEAMADALGVQYVPHTTTRQLKSSVEFVLKHCGLMLVFDEAAWLIPQGYTRTTAPMRLNYIRSQVLEAGCPVALVKTPQFFGPAAQRFENVTGYNFAQWRGRIMRSVNLPSELPEDDLIAVARHHFPELAADGIKRVVGCALISDSYLFAVLKIAKNARAVARKKGGEEITLDDVNAGIALSGIIVAQASSVAESSAPRPQKIKQPIAVKRGTGPAPFTAAVALTPPVRELTPALQTVNLH